MTNLLIQIRAADRAAFWTAAIVIGLGKIEPDLDANDQFVTSANINVHDGEGAGLRIVTVPAQYDGGGNETAPAKLAAQYHANIVINGAAVDAKSVRIMRWINIWQKRGAITPERGTATGRMAMGVSLISGVRTPQHGVAL